MFLPMTKEELQKLRWEKLDIILVTGDAYIDVPSTGIAVIGKYLVSKGFRVGVISQPDINSGDDILKLGEPELFWGVSAGAVDSMVANYTATMKRRKSCDFTPDLENNKRPDRATIVYAGLIKRYSKANKPIVLGGIEASLRRISHYDYQTDKVRKSILFDSKADIISYGNGEKSILELALAFKENKDFKNIDGICYIARDIPEGAVVLPSFEEVCADKKRFVEMFKVFSENSDPISGKTLVQKTLDRYLVQNKPWVMTGELLDEVNNLDYEREVHPSIKGEVRATETVRFSVMSHRGCFGGCSFCSINAHQGRRVVSRSEQSIMKEVGDILKHKKFKGIISDIGGATANMYRMKCAKMEKLGACKDRDCLFPTVCKSMDVNHKPLIDLLKNVRKLSGVRKVFASSSLRCDIVMADAENGMEYARQIISEHVSGQLKLAPESADGKTLEAMRKPTLKSFIDFIKIYKDLSKKCGKEQYISCYFIAAHPGCDEKSMKNTKKFIDDYLDFSPEQVQIFTPTPSTWATCFYYTELDKDMNKIFVEKGLKNKQMQKDMLTDNKRRAFYDKNAPLQKKKY